MQYELLTFFFIKWYLCSLEVCWMFWQYNIERRNIKWSLIAFHREVVADKVNFLIYIKKKQSRTPTIRYQYQHKELLDQMDECRKAALVGDGLGNRKYWVEVNRLISLNTNHKDWNVLFFYVLICYFWEGILLKLSILHGFQNSCGICTWSTMKLRKAHLLF